jgi:hypothetical protein
MVVRPVEIVRGVKGICNALKIGKREAEKLIRFDRDEQLGCITRDSNKCLRADVAELWNLYKAWCDREESGV